MSSYFGFTLQRCSLFYPHRNSNTTSTRSFVLLWNGIITENSIRGMFSDSLRAWAQIPLISHSQIRPLLDFSLFVNSLVSIILYGIFKMIIVSKHLYWKCIQFWSYLVHKTSDWPNDKSKNYLIKHIIVLHKII